MTYLVWSNEHEMWWRPGRSGYTGSIDEAGRHARAEADEIVATATCDGALARTRTDPMTGEQYKQFSEVVVLAPEAAA
jgi:hypothetical protein